ncbi:hypothetical protein FMN50_03570 [Rhodobacterales bacterium]|nr:hypothetical protein FMN50_03570 [Rhodobacterales bacterium]
MKRYRRGATLLAAGAVLAACQTLGGSANIVHKTGSTVEQRREVIDTCQVAALREVPPAYKVRSTSIGGGFSPGFCTGFSCYGYGGYPYQTAITSYDPNDALRARQFNRCLAAKGYTVLSRPVCTTEQQAVAYAGRKRQASASDIACVAGEPTIEYRWLRTR